jgi:hypothetical protein
LEEYFMFFGDRNPLSITTGIFCEPFSAGSAIAALLESGFSELDIQAVGVLEGHGPAAEEMLLASGISCEDATLYGELFEDGALLVVVRLDEEGIKQQVATDVLKKHGGVHMRSQTVHASSAERFYAGRLELDDGADEENVA